MTGLTDRQAVLLELSGMLEMVEWKVTAARSSFVGTPSTADHESAEYLKKVSAGLERLREWTKKNGWRPES